MPHVYAIRLNFASCGGILAGFIFILDIVSEISRFSLRFLFAIHE